MASKPISPLVSLKPVARAPSRSSVSNVVAGAPFSQAAAGPPIEATTQPLTLAIDIGGSHIKVGVLDAVGHLTRAATPVPTPVTGGPTAVVAAIVTMAQALGEFDRVSVGFPGVVRDGRVLTAPNLGTEAWHGFPLGDDLAKRFGKPVRVLNDASVQGLGVIEGVGLECVITLGTGFGFALFENGLLAPHMELGQHPCTKGHTYDQYLGEAALKAVGKTKWNKRLVKAIGFLDTLIVFDVLLIGGGNARHITLSLPSNVRTVPNSAGVTGGVRLWYPAMAPAFAKPSLPYRDAPTGITPAPEA